MKYIYISLIVIIFTPINSLAEEEQTKSTQIQLNSRTSQEVSSDSKSVPLLPIPTQIPPPPPIKVEGEEIDYAYGAYQRGFFLTALQLATQEALNGDHAAQTLLGVIYQSGQVVPRDLKKAREWYEIASNNGNVQAAYRLGFFYLNGLGGLNHDFEQAHKYFTVAADAGDLTAQLNLGLLYLEGNEIPRNLEKAEKLFEAVANKNVADAQYTLGVALFDGELGLPDKKRGMDWLKKASENDHISAQVRYGINRYQGIGTEADKRDGAEWLLKAANAGNPVAMNRVAQIYRIGEGFDIDVIEAAKWHIISQQWEGIPDLQLETFVQSLSEEELEEANNRANKWLF